ncbi:hypothetical protein EJ05DRAFT_476612 [Pseudovirgaria hyperparasitica]|uniref:GST N-terminal domain-containing protein n=1 Tax=Pseudovirgaria hyperparasitica TaxID=470096 RepID=A0A6A6W403_9PEZI|nr:uncharacterized protein EJ05DRAFT_476612 [Pseudovirgaria hyperparasitica]KAF2757343.1 hypothetical protein EJ05DRAFT_476612 [Pseudovirgaria hyperparasitica]
MASQTKPDITLYDLACTKGVCFSPVVWRIRLMLNYKKVPYKTVFLEFPDIEPELKKLGIHPHSDASSTKPAYTVPAIIHHPSSTYLMDSVHISQFLESTYPHPPVPLSTTFGDGIILAARSTGVPAYRISLLSREISILSPRSQEYFRSTREKDLGHPLEQLLEGDKEEKVWAEQQEGMEELGRSMRANKAKGMFLEGKEPVYADFWIAGVMQCARVVDEGVWERFMGFEGWRDVYEACEEFMTKKD